MDNKYIHFESKLMLRLIKLAKKKRGISKPNPLVAAAIVKDEQIISIGVHDKAGTPHAEPIAIDKTKGKTKGTTLYVTLEPCTHFGRTPPCVDAIIKAGISRVVYPFSDPNPLVKKNPAKKILEAKGIKVDIGLCSDEAKVLNEAYLKNMLSEKPFVTLKVAMSLDGKIALANGESKYITSEISRKEVHKMRREHEGIIVGINTILQDDPSLNVRFNLLSTKYNPPLIIILDSKLQTPPNARIFSAKKHGPIIIITAKNAPLINKKLLKNQAEIIEVAHQESGLDWNIILKKLFELDIKSVMIEGGQKVFTSAIKAKIADKLVFFIAPKLILAKNALSPFVLKDINKLDQAQNLKEVEIKNLKSDVIVSGYFNSPKDWL